MRRLREALQIGLPLLGMAVLFASVVMVPAGQRVPQLIVVLIGILILEAGVWGLTHPFLPEERKYLALREEGDFFISLIRELNAAAISEERDTEAGEKRFKEVLSVMHVSVEHMGVVAGIADTDEGLDLPSGGEGAGPPDEGEGPSDENVASVDDGDGSQDEGLDSMDHDPREV